jgi:hypothetical protein
MEIKINPNKQKKRKNQNPEFKYIDEVPKENLQGNRIFVDPGKRSLLMMMTRGSSFLHQQTIFERN